MVEALRLAVRGTLRGKERVVDLALTAVLAGGHILLQDVPGVGKTTLAAGLAAVLGGRFSRIQFTADLLPGDLTGVVVLDGGEFTFRPGPLFAHVVLADEINRTTPKTQSALLEAMEERRVTVDGVSHPLPSPYLVVATQNPHDLHGTYPLPESQLDRFMVQLSVGYPDREAEREIVRQEGRRPLPEPVVDPAGVLALTRRAAQVRVFEPVEDYLLDLVRASRTDARLVRGVSPRGAQALFRACRAWAVVQGRDYVIPEDVRELAVPVLAHRVLARTPDAAAAAVGDLLDELPAPR